MINWPPTLQTSAPFHCSSAVAGGLGGAWRHYLCKQDDQTFTEDKHLNALCSPGGSGGQVGGGSTWLNVHLVAAFTRRVSGAAKKTQANEEKQKGWTQLKVYTAKGEGRDGFGKKKRENSSKEAGRVLE